MSKQFFIADTHFGHKNIIEYENRPFNSINDMDNVIIENWNKTVKDTDYIYILGDFALSNKNRIIELIKILNGYKVFILGNHDKDYSYSWWNTVGLDMVCAYPIIINEWFILSHEPIYVNTNMPYVNIFGHVHANPQYQNFSKHHFCVSCERINYTPIELSEITKMIK